MTDHGSRAAEATPPSLMRGAAAGLIAGVLASFAMDRFQAAVAAMSSSDGDGEPATDKAAGAITKALAGHELADADKPLGGQLVHYALGAGLGIVYGIVAEYRDGVTKGYGAGFGVGVAALLDDAAVPALGLADPPWRSNAATHAFSLASHLTFGVALEFTRRQARSTF